MADHAGLRRAGRPRGVDVREEVVLVDRGGRVEERVRVLGAVRAAARSQLVEIRERPARAGERRATRASRSCASSSHSTPTASECVERRTARPSPSCSRRSGTPIAPTRLSAKSNSAHSSVVCARIANASPLRMPRASSPCASSSTVSAASSHDTSCQHAVALDQVCGRRPVRGDGVEPEAPDRPPPARAALGLDAHRLRHRAKRSGGTSAEGRKRSVPLQSRFSMRTIWNGSLSFGLVNIPIGLALATSPKARASDVSFRQLHRECRTPIRQKRWCPTHDREVGPDEIVKGWEVAKGEFVDHRGRGPRGDPARRRLARDRHHALRPARPGRPGVLRPDVLPRRRRARRRSGGRTCCCSRR